jgi:hypothetical protein
MGTLLKLFADICKRMWKAGASYVARQAVRPAIRKPRGTDQSREDEEPATKPAAPTAP